MGRPIKVAAVNVRPDEVPLIVKRNVECISIELIDEVFRNVFASAESHILFLVANLFGNLDRLTLLIGQSPSPQSIAGRSQLRSDWPWDVKSSPIANAAL